MYDPFRKQITFVHTGHIGDIIAFLPLFQALRGTRLIVRDEPWMNPPMSGFRYDSLKPLLEYLGIETHLNVSHFPVDYDTAGWRECYDNFISLTDSQARFLGLVSKKTGHFKIDGPWIEVKSDPLTKGRVIFNRSPRYRNYDFPWKQVHSHFGNRALFVGTPDEHNLYCAEVGDIEHYPTKNCLDVARAISGSDFFVGNQSSACWIAMGLRKKLLQETFVPAPNSSIPYNGAWYGFAENIPFDKLE
jgi:hypothetical protein